jgi:hypothetical protein
VSAGAGTGRQAWLRAMCRKAWRFKSSPAHHTLVPVFFGRQEKIPGFAGIFVFLNSAPKGFALERDRRNPVESLIGAICFVAEETFRVSYGTIKLQHVTAPSAFASSETCTVTT